MVDDRDGGQGVWGGACSGEGGFGDGKRLSLQQSEEGGEGEEQMSGRNYAFKWDDCTVRVR